MWLEDVEDWNLLKVLFRRDFFGRSRAWYDVRNLLILSLASKRWVA